MKKYFYQKIIISDYCYFVVQKKIPTALPMVFILLFSSKRIGTGSINYFTVISTYTKYDDLM